MDQDRPTQPNNTRTIASATATVVVAGAPVKICRLPHGQTSTLQEPTETVKRWKIRSEVVLCETLRDECCVRHMVLGQLSLELWARDSGPKRSLKGVQKSFGPGPRPSSEAEATPGGAVCVTLFGPLFGPLRRASSFATGPLVEQLSSISRATEDPPRRPCPWVLRGSDVRLLGNSHEKRGASSSGHTGQVDRGGARERPHVRSEGCSEFRSEFRAQGPDVVKNLCHWRRFLQGSRC